MNNTDQHSSPVTDKVGRLVTLGVLFVVAHAAFVLLGYACKFGETTITTFWPCTGFALAVLLSSDRRWWPAFLGLMLVVETAMAGTQWSSFDGIVARGANMLEAALGASLIRWRLGRPVHRWGLKTVTVIIGAAALAAAVGGLIAAAGFVMQSADKEFRVVFNKCFFAAGLGIILIVSLLLTWSEALRRRQSLGPPRSLIEPAVCLLITLLAAEFVFGASWLPTLSVLDHPYLLSPLLIWAALRFQPRMVTIILLLTALVLVLNARDGKGPFAMPGEPVRARVLAIQAYLAVMAAATLVLSAVVTDRKRAYGELAESEERFRLAIEAVGEGAYDWNVQTGEVHVSDRWLRSLGYEREQFPQMFSFWENLLHPDDKTRVRAELDEHLAGRTDRFESEYRISRQTSDYRWTRDRGRVIVRDADGKPVRMVGTEDDVTVRKTAEDQLAQMELKLAHVARLSTMGELVAGIAHEVNQPLYAIVNFAKASRNVLAQGEAPDLDTLRDWNEQIAEAAVRAGAIIKRLRSFVSRGVPQRSSADANELVHGVCELMDFSLRRSRARVELELASDLPPVMVDAVQIQQVLVNLVQNACEAMEEAGVAKRRLAIRTRPFEGFVSVTVADSGPGLPQDSRLQLFDSFVTTKPEGLGMGLAISRTIIEAHGGKLWAGSSPEGGAEFLFTLPTEMRDEHNVV